MINQATINSYPIILSKKDSEGEILLVDKGHEYVVCIRYHGYKDWSGGRYFTHRGENQADQLLKAVAFFNVR